MAATMAPGFSAFTSSGDGPAHLEQDVGTARARRPRVAAMSAPCACSASSEKRERAPAPASTFTVAPSADELLDRLRRHRDARLVRRLGRDGYGDHGRFPGQLTVGRAPAACDEGAAAAR